MPSPPPPSFNISFQNEVTIYQQNVICHVKDNEFNLSYNPTLLKNNLQSIKKLAEREGISINKLIKILKSGE